MHRQGTPAPRFDVRAYKALIQDSRVEVVFRLALLSPAAVLAAYTFEDAAFYGFIILHNLCILAFVGLAFRGPDGGSLAYVVLFYGLGLVALVVLLGAAVYCWVIYGETGRLLALMLLLGTMLNSIGLRTQDTLAVRLESGLIALTMLGLGMLTLMTGIDKISVMKAVGLFGGLAYYVIALDTTMRTNAALKEARNQEVKRARLEAIGQITGGVAHDFNNLLTVIKGNLELHRDMLEEGHAVDGEETADLLREAEIATDRAALTTRQLLNYTRSATLQSEKLDLGPLIYGLAPLYERMLPDRIVFLVDVACPPPPLVQIDRVGLENVLLNLVINGRDALPDGGTIALRLTNQSADGHVRLTVEDTGTGIPGTLMERVTEPYFTTKPVGKGSGLGLAMAKGFMDQSGGSLQIDSQLGRGTRVHLCFPPAS